MHLPQNTQAVVRAKAVWGPKRLLLAVMLIAVSLSLTSNGGIYST